MNNSSLDTEVRAMTRQRPSPENVGKYRALSCAQYACIGLAVAGAAAAVLNIYPRNPPQYRKAFVSALAAVCLASQSQYFNLEKQRLTPPVRKVRRPQNPQS